MMVKYTAKHNINCQMHLFAITDILFRCAIHLFTKKQPDHTVVKKNKNMNVEKKVSESW